MTAASAHQEDEGRRETAQTERPSSPRILFPRVPPPRGVLAKAAPVRVEVNELSPNGCPEELNVLCRGCERLLFRVRAVRHQLALEDDGVMPWVRYQDAYEVERRCHSSRCSRITSVYLTKRPGHPLEVHGHDGLWHCTCGSYLGRTIGARGRFIMKCRHCRHEIRVTVADCMIPDVLDAAVKAYKRAHPELSDDTDDLPF